MKKTRQKFWVFMNSFCHVFGISQIRKNYQRNSSTLKHALVNKNRINDWMKNHKVISFKVGFNITNSQSHKSYITKSKVILSVLHALLHIIFLHQEKKTKYFSYISIPKIRIYLCIFISFYFHTIHRVCFPKNADSFVWRVTWLCVIFWNHYEMGESNHAHSTAV